MYDYSQAEMKTTTLGLCQRQDLKSSIDDQIINIEKKLSDLKELKSILESEPKMNRALEILRNGNMY